MKTALFALLLVITLVLNVLGFTKDDHDIFRLKDELALAEGDSVTFYDFIGVRPSASQDEVTKACRKKSKSTHPDKAKQAFIASRAKAPPKKSGQQGKKPGVHVGKSPSEKEIREAVDEATKRHARLSGVAEILKGEGRERYDYFLANGFPRWRGTGYYYARFRPGLGSVLAGLFVAGGGFAHYGALYVSWKRQQEFVERYIRHARRAAWGDDSGVSGIPGIDGITASAPSLLAQDNGAVPLNRRQKRQQERENKKEKDGAKSKGVRHSGPSTPLEADSAVEPQGAKKRVQAENGKTLIVDSAGNVFLEGEDEHGEKQEYLLDPNEIAKPTIRQTLVFRLPLWTWNLVNRRFRGNEEEVTPVALNGAARDDHMVDIAKASIDGPSRKRGKRSGKAN
ncbi:MAG: hypothetical protein LQ345_000934 [Seirophora villosa]|nr:MAG: hypothetical protein LQ345_000934 [Seirophora villosa]